MAGLPRQSIRDSRFVDVVPERSTLAENEGLEGGGPARHRASRTAGSRRPLTQWFPGRRSSVQTGEWFSFRPFSKDGGRHRNRRGTAPSVRSTQRLNGPMAGERNGPGQAFGAGAGV